MLESKTHSKKKRKRDKISGSLSEEQMLSRERCPDESEVNLTKKNKEAKKRKKNKKRKKVEEESCDAIEPAATSASDTEQQQNDSTKETKKPSKQKKKKKRKKRAKQDLSSSANKDDNGCNKVDIENGTVGDDANDDENEVVLEGSMISDILVLIDRKSGKVFSAMEERLENGERKQVGRLDGKGQVVLFHKTDDQENGKESDELPKTNDSNEHTESNDPSSAFPYEVDPDDHCESPLEAYKDIVPLLESYRRWIRKQSNNQLSIYDPYFCNGRVARHLESLGFPDVYNRKEDCYKVWSDQSKYPNYDVFMTNPPYSCDHIEKLMRHVTSKQNQKKPWMLLMPNFVHKKDYFQQFTADTGQLPIYLVPKKRYIYQPPPNMRAKKASSTHKKSSPFVCGIFGEGVGKSQTSGTVC